MTTGSIRKKGKRWYYRFYMEDAAGVRRQREFAGTESRTETEQLLKDALLAYEKERRTPQCSSIPTLAALLDAWGDEALIPGDLTNSTVSNYLGIIRRIKQYPISERKIDRITTMQLQEFFNVLCFGGVDRCGDYSRPYSKDYLHAFYAVLQGAFCFAVYPRQYLTDNPMQYVQFHRKQPQYELFPEKAEQKETQHVLSEKQFLTLCAYLANANPSALLPVQIAYYTGLRIGEVCGLVWNDINLQEQYLTVRRSVRYNNARHRLEISAPKRKSVRCVDFCDSLCRILRAAREKQQNAGNADGFHRNFYRIVQEQGRIYYELYHIPMSDPVPPDFVPLSMVCLRPNGAYEAPSTLEVACKVARRRLPELGGFHFHTLRHTYTNNLLRRGASPKEVQELLGHADIHTTMNIYAHAFRDSIRSISRQLDQPIE